MSITTDVAAFKAATDTNITTKDTPNSIPPDVVGDALNDLADLLETYYGVTFNVLTGTGVPNDADGADSDLYFRNNNPLEIYQKEAGAWGAPKATIDLGIVFPDGPLIGLLTRLSGMVVTVTAGGWTINNVIYRKATETQFTLGAADANFGRYDLIYADENDDVLILAGTAASTPAIPTLPADCIMIDVAFIPAASSGNPAYLLYGTNSNTDAAGKYVISKTEADLVATGGGNWYLELTDSGGAALPANVRPYSISVNQAGVESPVPALVYNDAGWDHPRIYGFPDSANAQAITVYAI